MSPCSFPSVKIGRLARLDVGVCVVVGLVAEAVGVDAPVAGVLEPAVALGFAASGRRVVTPAVVVLGLVVFYHCLSW